MPGQGGRGRMHIGRSAAHGSQGNLVPTGCLCTCSSVPAQAPPKESRDRFKALVVIQETFYNFELTAALTRAIRDTETAVTAHYALPPTAPIPAAAGPS